MAEIRPFRALRYDPARVALERVLAPVYDVVTPEERVRFWERDPHNAVRLELTKRVEDEASTDYADVGRTLAAWRKEGVLRLDAQPAFHALRQRFRAPDGRAHARTGFFAALRLEDYGRRIVRPHERTLAGPKADRLKILRATRTNLSAVFLLYEDPDGKLDALLEQALSAPATQRAQDAGGVANELAALDDPSAIAEIVRFLAPRPLVIADGHHRYETGLAFRAEDDRPGAQDLFVYLANAYAAGSLLLPIHRLLVRAPRPSDARWAELTRAGWTQREVALGGVEALDATLRDALAPHTGAPAFAADDGSGRLRIFTRPASAELSIEVFHREIVLGFFGLDEEAVRGGAVAFPKAALEAARDVREGRGTIALYLNPLRPEDVFRVTAAGATLPQKSTFFYPKLATGLLFRSLDES